MAEQSADISLLLPGAKTLIGIVCRLNRDNVRPPARSVANLEFHHGTDHVNVVARKIVSELERRRIRAGNGGAAGFPMEADRWVGKMWLISHKPVAVAAGLGRMGIHRNVIHPKFGNFIIPGTVLIEAEVTEYSWPIQLVMALYGNLRIRRGPGQKWRTCGAALVRPDALHEVEATQTQSFTPGSVVRCR